MKNRKRLCLLGDIVGMLAAGIIFIIPFLFIFLNSLKGRREANLLDLSLPSVWEWGNYKAVFEANNHIILTAFKNSFLITLGAIILLISFSSMSGYVLQRRKDRLTRAVNVMIMTGLMIPPAILPTIWIMKGIHIYKTLAGIILIEVALQTPFTIMLFRGFMGSIPTELEEAGVIDGCSPFSLFRQVIFPLLKPVTSTVVILNSVTIFNDFMNPLYFMPGSKNATVQLTLYNFMGQYSSSYNLLFADVMTITVPMLILFIIFNKKIVDGMVAGAVKG
ncbi:carbohydrate ABC transporter permease [Murimonas intestini]|uniref:Raffinose/stachyose/melibiose transport system permease protein n=1 Tax=Murimonas intestini TaxID=1337051 RepID=A0AB73T2S3_9FIRM|nr:carbohydrate ABC transporter permease [Murimonas intestini]MCR1841840.1 carbohydrate ABC transporter permease [Murimonas intestini]MCR1865656.1 carbohydrate ABC transporter permease [Murimonas intestini]MCR1886323.1 carbohydrate ABC transporter permease [Murimonas intestini]